MITLLDLFIKLPEARQMCSEFTLVFADRSEPDEVSEDHEELERVGFGLMLVYEHDTLEEVRRLRIMLSLCVEVRQGSEHRDKVRVFRPEFQLLGLQNLLHHLFGFRVVLLRQIHVEQVTPESGGSGVLQVWSLLTQRQRSLVERFGLRVLA